MQEEKIIYKKSTIPYYAVGFIWVIYAFLFTMYRWIDFLIVGSISVIVFIVLRKVIEPKEVTIVVDVVREDTGNKVANSLIDILENQIRMLSKYQFCRDTLSKNSQDIRQSCQQLIISIKKEPNKASSIERAIIYLDSLLLKFIDQHDYFSKLDMKNETVQSGLLQIEKAFSNINQVYQKQIDELNKNQVIDLQLDIQVMESMFHQDELDIESFIKQSKGENKNE